MRRVPLLSVVLLLAVGCDSQPDISGPAPSEASLAQSAARAMPVMDFGNPDAGSPFPPPDHDRSFHAKDKINPRTLVIQAGETVTFNVMPTHRAAVYDDGIQPEDIEVSPATLIALGGVPGLGFDDPQGRLGIQPIGDFSFVTPSQWTFTFTEPGRYLVVCGFTPHFVEANMYGWVIVK